MDLLEVALPTAEPSSTVVLTTVSSDGKINLYDLARLPRAAAAPETPSASKGKGKGKGKQAPAAPAPADELPQVEPSATFDTDKTRLTCVTAIGMVEKRVKSGENGEEQPGEDDDSSSEEEEHSDDGDGLEQEGESEGEEESEEDEEEDEDEEEFAGIEEED